MQGYTTAAGDSPQTHLTPSMHRLIPHFFLIHITGALQCTKVFCIISYAQNINCYDYLIICCYRAIMQAIREMAKKKTTNHGVNAPRHLSQSDFRKLMHYIRRQADLARQKGNTRAVVDEMIILLLTSAGLRAGEVCNLRIADLPASRGENTLSVRDRTGTITRTVDLNEETAGSLNRFGKLYRNNAQPDAPLLVSERGTPFTYMSLYSKVKKIGQRARVGRLYPHMLRRTFMVRLYNSERDLRLVQLQAGHVRPATTLMYAALSHRRWSACDGRSPEAKAAPAEQPEVTEPSTQQKPPSTSVCEACGVHLSADAATTIDSGQNICPACLKELRRISSSA